MFYLKLAMTNIKKNGKIYFPYLITSIFTVMMFYCVKFLGGDNGLRKDSESAAMMMSLGVYVVIIFSVIFLLYINSIISLLNRTPVNTPNPKEIKKQSMFQKR